MTPEREMLLFIGTFIDEHGWAPTYRDLQEGLSIPSKSTVHRRLLALQKQGKVRLGNGPRMIALVRDA